MKISLCTVPVEPQYLDLQPKSVPGADAFSIRSEGRLPIQPKLAIVSLVKWMEKHGYGPGTYDYYDIDMELPDDERLRRYFREARPDVVGLSAVVSTAYFQVRRISRIAREELPGAWIVLGGSLAASAGLILRRTAVDLCVLGDGEITWLRLLELFSKAGRRPGAEALAAVPGLAYLDEAGELRSTGYGPPIPAEDLPFPDYELLKSGLKDRPEDLKYYFRKGLDTFEFQTDPRSYEKGRRPNMAALLTSKGCVARCTFCQRPTSRYRVPRLEALARHVAELKERFDVGFVVFCDENFGSDIAYARGCAELMRKHGMLWWGNGVRVSSLSRKDIRLFHDCGCCCLSFGVETGSQKMLDVMEKRFTVERVYEALKDCADHDVLSPLAVMVGMPGEDEESAAATGRFLGRISHAQGLDPEYQQIRVFYALPIAGTPLYGYGQQAGIIGRTPEAEEELLLSISGGGPSKENYINLNGAPMREVVFWDWLVKLEAARTFLELDRARPIDRTRFMHRAAADQANLEACRMAVTRRLSVGEVLDRMRRGVPTGLKGKLFYAFDNFLEHQVAYSPLAHKLPRWLLYGAVKNTLYLVFQAQRLMAWASGRRYNIFRRWPRVPRLILETRAQPDRPGMSLRAVVKARQAAEPPKTAAEKNREFLAFGL